MSNKTLSPFYAAEVARLAKGNYSTLLHNWSEGDDHKPYSPLFAYASPAGTTGARPDGQRVGCLTMIRLGNHVAWTDDLTERIRLDKRIPKTVDALRESHLPVFAEWQEVLDAEIRPKPLELIYKPHLLDAKCLLLEHDENE